jgi:hypothetical protein
MREPLFCKKAVPAPSAKNSYMAGGRTNQCGRRSREARTCMSAPENDKPDGRMHRRECRGAWRCALRDLHVTVSFGLSLNGQEPESRLDPRMGPQSPPEFPCLSLDFSQG